MRNFFKFNMLLLLAILFVSGSALATEVEQVNGPSQKSGNKIGSWELEVTIGFISFTVKGIRCDDTENVICVEKAGIPVEDPHEKGYFIESYEDQDGDEFGGTLYDYIETMIGNDTNCEFYFFTDTYWSR